MPAQVKKQSSVFMPSHRRKHSVPTPAQNIRESVLKDQQPSVDGALKALRNASRQLKPIHASFSDELRLLERLYYKGKNQHKSALFWRKLAEARRIGNRIHGAGLLALVDELRATFHSQTDTTKTCVFVDCLWSYALKTVEVTKDLLGLMSLVGIMSCLFYTSSKGCICFCRRQEFSLRSHPP